MIFNDFEKKLQEICKQTNANGALATYFIHKIENHEPINNPSEISKHTSYSLSAITKFAKSMNCKNVSELILLQNLILREEFPSNELIKLHDNQKNIKKASELILNARKILFIGVSNGNIVNQDFARKLNRLDLWTVVNDSKYEQLGGSKILQEQDLLIFCSVSFQHQWMLHILRHKKCPAIVISGFKPEYIQKDDIFFDVGIQGERTGLRSFSINSRAKQFFHIDNIFKELLKNKNKFKLLEKSRYYKK